MQHGEVDLRCEPVVPLPPIHDKALLEPAEMQGEVDGAAQGDGAEEVVEDVAHLAGHRQPELTLLENVNLQKILSENQSLCWIEAQIHSVE